MKIFETKRLIARRFVMSDLEAILAWKSDPEVARYEYWQPYTAAAVHAELLKLVNRPPGAIGVWNEYGLELKAEGRLVGSVSLRLSDPVHRQAEIGFKLLPSEQGKGYATEGGRGLLANAVSLGAHRIFSVVDARNASSIALLERLGLRLEAHFRENCFVKGEWCDELVYAVLAWEIEQ